MTTRSIFAFSGLFLAVSSSFGQPIVVNYGTPSLDRWMYPFNGSPGTEQVASLFTPGPIAGFDDRDGEMLVGFNTASNIATAQGRLRYKILGATLKVFVENGGSFYYDPSADPLASSFVPTDPQYVADTDFSKPIEVWGCGYRNGFTAETFTETSPFGGTPLVQPAEGARNVFPALFDNAQAATDMSRQVRLKSSGTAMALARLFDDNNAELTPGTLVPQSTEVRFNLATVSSANYVYLQNSLNAGRIRLLLTSLEPATGGPGGGTGDVTYPRLYTKESSAASFGFGPQLSLEIAITCDADFTGDNVVDDADFVIFVNAYNELLDARCDLNGDTVTDDADFILFVSAYDTLLCD